MPLGITWTRKIEWNDDNAFDIFGDENEYVVAALRNRAAASTAMGWKNANLRCSGDSAWPRFVPSMQDNRLIHWKADKPSNLV
jgi:hypothetical protein